jgi:hypothetical protein
MSPKQFAECEQKVLGVIPIEGKPLFDVVKIIATDDSGYNHSDVKAAILGLKASGKVQLDDNGMVRRKSWLE